jgi:hypothetical protein
MAFKNKHFSHKIGTCECARCERDDFSAVKELSQLPKIKAKPGFDRKMAAAFALELEREVSQINQAWLRKSRGIRLPDLVSDFRGEFL